MKKKDIVIAIVDIGSYFKKGDRCILNSSYNGSNYVQILYRDKITGYWCVNSFWKWNFKKWEINKNITVL